MYKQLIIDTCKEYGLSRDEAAYVLGTVHWETNGTFEPVKEAYWVKNAEAWRKKNLRYYPWYGRGFIQLTWDYNYKKAGEKIGVDLIKNPDLAMEPKNSAKIAVLGMKEGWFTGKDLDDYIDSIPESAKEDFLEFYNARRIVNGMDKANNIAVLAERYEAELVNYDTKVEPAKENKAVRTLLSIIIAILRKLFSK
jgi:putative chitinase